MQGRAFLVEMTTAFRNGLDGFVVKRDGDDAFFFE